MTAGDGGAPGGKSRRTAVIAVHGVGIPEPGETARALSRLLASARGTSFRETGVEIPVALPDSVKKEATALADPEAAVPVVALLARGRLAASIRPNAGRAAERQSIDLALTAAHLAPYAPGDKAPRVYGSVRLEEQGASSDRAVDVFEMYWADLSKSSPSRWALARRMVALPSHLLSIARYTLSYAGSAAGGSAWWRFASAMVLASFVLLIGAVPVLNAAWLAALTSAAPLQLSDGVQRTIAIGLPALAAFVVMTRLAYVQGVSNGVLVFLAPLVAAAVAAGAVWVGVSRWPARLGDVLALEWIALIWLVIHVVVSAIELRRPLRWALGSAMAATLLLYVAGLVWAPAPPPFAGEDLLRDTVGRGDVARVFCCEVLTALLAVAWPLLILLACAIVVACSMGALTEPAPGKSGARKGWHAAGTAVTGVTISLVCVELVQRLFIAGLSDERFRKAAYVWTKVTLLCEPVGSIAVTAICYSLPLCAAVLGAVAVVASAVVLTPSIGYEISPPAQSSKDASSRLGRWLSLGARLLLPLCVASFLVGVIAPIASLQPILSGQRLGEDLETLTDALWKILASGALAAAIAFARSDDVARATWPVFGVIFDIDAYLNEMPRNATPRARMVERMASLLAYLGPREGTDGYDRIVFVAHSQGTILTADTLRFLSGAMKLPPMKVITLGCPLRAIYGRMFPHLYAWVDGDVRSPSGPNPKGLGVELWRNAYRSGDYIGRDLWSWGEKENPFGRNATHDGHRWLETCLGAGAHMAYWEDDDTATVVTAILDM